MIIERREDCSRYFYYGFIYDIMTYYRYDYYMGGFLVELEYRYMQSVGIITYEKYTVGRK